MVGLKDLLLNLVFIVVPFFVYQTFWGDSHKGPLPMWYQRFICVPLLAVSMILCMTFPVHAIPGLILDLRLVPLLIGILYGDVWIGIFTTLLMFGYRMLMQDSGPGLTYMFLSFPVLIIAAFVLSSRFKTSSRMKKWAILSALVLYEMVFTTLAVLLSMDVPFYQNPYLPFFIVFTAVYLLTAWMVIFLIENMLEKWLITREVQRTEKVQVLGELAASIAHEVRNPLTVVRGFLQLLKDDTLPPEKRQFFLQMGIEELDRSESIISSYLSYARPQIKKLEKVDATEHLRHVADLLQSFALLRNVEIQHQSEAGLYIEADKEKLSQVLINLIKNGIEAMEDGGKIELEAHRKSRHIHILVRDNGVGMTEEETKRLGDPYFSTKEKGTGLGVMVCYQIIRSMNGDVHVTSAKGKGTEFLLTIPEYSE